MKTITTSTLDEAVVPDDPIVAIDAMRHAGADQNRWHDIDLYQLDDGTYVCHIQYCTEWDGELDHDILLRAPDLAALRNQLRNHAMSIESYVRGFPPTPMYAERQANLLQWIRARFGDTGKQLIKCARAAEVQP